jgi:uncharacterized protein (DUF1501 family)
MNRREFLTKTGIITTGTLLVPSFLKASLLSNNLNGINNKNKLIIIQLSGGNDGLNSIVPYGLDEYYQNRSGIGISLKDLLKIDDKFGFHPKLSGLHKLHDRGLLSIINSVGYPNPNRSHFRSMDIWHTASDHDKFKTTGWIGNYLDNNCQNPYEAIELNGELSLALKGKSRSGIALTNPITFRNTINSEYYKNINNPETKNSELDFMYKVFNDTKNSAQYIFDQYKLKPNNTEYGKSQFEQKLKKIATLIKSDIQTPIFYSSLGGFDTHVNQNGAHNNLYDQLNNGISTLVEDLEKDKLLDNTTIVVFSEFGRRLKENASRGTDHGAANVMFVIDSKLNKKAHNYNQLDLTVLEKGDPIYKTDFRSVYQELLEFKLNVDAKSILGNTYQNLGLFN